MPAFQIAASIVLLLVALDMLRAQRSRVRETAEETEAGVKKTDIAVTPLAIPMLAGPGAISTVILLHHQAADFEQQVALYFWIVAICVASFFILRLAEHGARWLSPIALNITTRIMGLLLAAVAIQFIPETAKGHRVVLTALGFLNPRPGEWPGYVRVCCRSRSR
jgi:multiple antibiotic resistance protein